MRWSLKPRIYVSRPVVEWYLLQSVDLTLDGFKTFAPSEDIVKDGGDQKYLTFLIAPREWGIALK